MVNTIPVEIVAEDQRLDAQARSAQIELARLRWHWTLDDDNPDRVSFRAYADAVGRRLKTISAMANGYGHWLAEQGDGDVPVTPRSLTDHIELANVGETKRQAALAIADAEGVRVSNVLTHKRDAVRNVIAHAQEAAERRGTDVETEIQREVDTRKRSRDHDASRKAARAAKTDLRYIEIEKLIGSAKRNLAKALEVAEGVPFDQEERELLADSIGNLRALINLLDVRIVGTADIDWDAELAKIGDVK